jgi:hypothetical protein
MGMGMKIMAKSLKIDRADIAMTLSILSKVLYRRVLRVIAESENGE